jgi:hypothetical protein
MGKEITLPSKWMENAYLLLRAGVKPLIPFYSQHVMVFQASPREFEAEKGNRDLW